MKKKAVGKEEAGKKAAKKEKAATKDSRSLSGHPVPSSSSCMLLLFIISPFPLGLCNILALGRH